MIVTIFEPATSRIVPVAMIEPWPFMRRGTDATVPNVPGFVSCIVPPAKSSGKSRLLRAFSTEQAHIHDGPGQRDAATRRLLDHYVHTAHTANRLFDPYRDSTTLAPAQPAGAAFALLLALSFRIPRTAPRSSTDSVIARLT